jgi:hypothetical protein
MPAGSGVSNTNDDEWVYANPNKKAASEEPLPRIFGIVLLVHIH